MPAYHKAYAISKRMGGANMDISINDLIRERRKLLAYEREEAPIEITHIYDIQGQDRLELSRRFGQQPARGSSIQCPRPVTEIRTLTEEERCIFEQQDFVSRNYCIQFLYKVSGEIDRDQFRENVHKMFRDNPDLRVNFVPLGLERKYHKVVFEDCCPEVNYTSLNCLVGETLDHALQRTMAIDRRTGFNIENDVLMRILIINTLRKNEYAVLLTESRLIANAWKGKEFLQMAWRGMDASASPVEFPETGFSNAAYNHWERILYNLPTPPSLPGYKGYDLRYERVLHHVRPDKTDHSLLLGRAGGRRDMLITILHTSWGLLQRHVERTRATRYCLLLPDNDMNLQNATERAGIVRPIPMRLACDEDQLVKELIGEQFQQMSQSKSAPVPYMKDILTNTGQTLAAFPYLLHFHNFLPGKESFSESDASTNNGLVDMYAWDAGIENFGMYFDLNGKEVTYTIAYNEHCFSSMNIQSIAQAFNVILRSVLCLWDQNIAALDGQLKKSLRSWDKTYSFFLR